MKKNTVFLLLSMVFLTGCTVCAGQLFLASGVIGNNCCDVKNEVEESNTSTVHNNVALDNNSIPAPTPSPIPTPKPTTTPSPSPTTSPPNNPIP